MNVRQIFLTQVKTFALAAMVCVSNSMAGQDYKPAIPATSPADDMVVLDLISDIYPSSGGSGRRTIHEDVLNTLTAIQGLVNRTSPSKIYFVNMPTYYPDSWKKNSKFHLENQWMLDLGIYPVPVTKPAVNTSKIYPVLSYLLEHYASYIRGKVLYPQIAGSSLEAINGDDTRIKYPPETAALAAAITACGIEDAIPVSNAIDAYIQEEGYDFPLKADTRGLMTSEAAYDWARENYFRPETNRKFIGMFSIEHIYAPSFHDYYIANRAFVVVFNRKVSSHYSRLADLLREYPDGAPLLGGVVGNESEFYELGSKTTILMIGNTSATSSFVFNPGDLPEPVQPQPLPVKNNGVYVAFYAGDGDGPGLVQNQNIEIFREHQDALDDIYYDIQVCPYYMDMNPPLMQWWMKQQSRRLTLSTSLHGGVPGHTGGRRYFKKLHKYYFDHARNNLQVYNQLREKAHDVPQYFEPYVKMRGWGNLTTSPSPIEQITGTNSIQIQIIDGYHDKVGGDKEKAIMKGIQNSSGNEPVFMLIKATGGWSNGIVDNVYEIRNLMNKLKANPPGGREIYFCTPVDLAATWKKWKGIPTALPERDTKPEYPYPNSMQVTLTTGAKDTVLMSYDENIIIPEIIKDSAVQIKQVEFYAGDHLLGVSTTAPYAFTLPDTNLGAVSLYARSVAENGDYSWSRPWKVTVSSGDPMAELFTRDQKKEYNITDTVNLMADAVDYDGSIDSVQFYANDVYMGADRSAPFHYTWKNPPAGEYEVYARAWDDSLNHGRSSHQSITIYGYRPADEPGEINSGLVYEYYEGNWNIFPDFSGLHVLKKGTIAEFDVGPREREEDYAFRFRGYLQVTQRGLYTLYPDTGNPCRLYIGDRLVVDFKGLHEVAEKKGAVLLEKGLHSIKLEMYTNSEANTVKVSYEGPGIPSQDIPSSAFFRSTGRPPHVSVHIPETDAMYNEGEKIAIEAGVSDPDQDVYRVEYLLNDQLLGYRTDTGHGWTIDSLSGGFHDISVKAYDLGGSVSTSEPVTIYINTAPKVNLNAPALFSQFTGRDTIPVHVTVEDENTREVAIYVNEILTLTLTAPPWNCELQGLNKGTKYIRATATDINHAKGSAKVQIKVLNTPPLVFFIKPDSGAVFAPGERITLKAEVSDPDGDVYKVAFYEGSRQIGENANSYHETDIDNLSEGTHTIVARAYDKAGAVTDSDPVRIIVGKASAIESPEAGSQLLVYPSPPENGVLILESDGLFDEISECILVIKDITGRTRFQQQVSPSGNRITVQLNGKLTAGMFFITLQSVEGNWYKTRKIIW